MRTHLSSLISSLVLGLSWALMAPLAQAHDVPGAHHHAVEGEVGRWTFWPDYVLPGNGANYPGPRPAQVREPRAVMRVETDPTMLFGQAMTHRYEYLAEGARVPNGPFTVELWALRHGNRPVGAAASVFNDARKQAPIWTLGFFGDQIAFGALSADGREASIDIPQADLEAYKRYHHLVGVYDGAVFTLYHNGTRVAVARAPEGFHPAGDQASFDLSAYLGQEPYMDFANIIQGAVLYERALSAEEITEQFRRRAQLIDEGILFEDLFHFTAGPVLSTPTQTQMTVLAETDRASQMRIEWGRDVPLDFSREDLNPNRLHEFTMSGLEADTPYFYEVTAVNEAGEEIRSGILSFRTAPRSGQPFTFAVVGDTEARPYINDQIAKEIWGERPGFLMILGDLTDGGTQHHRFEWTHEFFLGLTQLISRVPLMAVPGNGEDDLVWYRHYNAFPEAENMYTFTYGDVQFFMLDTNFGEREREAPGFRQRQRAWLEDQLSRSNARWKIAAHHHPVYTSDENDHGNSWNSSDLKLGNENVRADFLDLYEAYGVDVVLFGHLHTYERSWALKDGAASVHDGVIYVQSGGAGGNLEDFTPNRNWFSRQTYAGNHYGIFEVSPDQLTYRMVDTEGRTRDRFTIEKSRRGRAQLADE